MLSVVDTTDRRRLRIRTSEGIEFSQPIASPVIRFLAAVIDYGIIGLGVQVVNAILMLFGVLSADFAVALTFLATFLLGVGYSIWFEWRGKGRTIGKRVLRIQVVSVDGSKLQFSQVVMRNLLRVVDLVPFFFGVGGIVALFDRLGRRLGDIVGGTVVVLNARVERPVIGTVEEEKYNSLRDRRVLVGRLRQEISPGMGELLLRAIERRESLDTSARIKLFDDLATWIKSLINIPDTLLDGVSNERFVVNVVDIIFQSERS